MQFQMLRCQFYIFSLSGLLKNFVFVKLFFNHDQHNRTTSTSGCDNDNSHGAIFVYWVCRSIVFNLIEIVIPHDIDDVLVCDQDNVINFHTSMLFAVVLAKPDSKNR